MPEQLLTVEQVANYLNVDKFTVYRLVADKNLPRSKSVVNGDSALR
jgi:excisionase family DNA binding protein